MYIFSLNICEILRFKRFSPRKLKIMTRACYQQKLTTTTTKVKQSHTDNNAQRAKKAKRKHERQKTTRPRRRHTKEPKKKTVQTNMYRICNWYKRKYISVFGLLFVHQNKKVRKKRDLSEKYIFLYDSKKKYKGDDDEHRTAPHSTQHNERINKKMH